MGLAEKKLLLTNTFCLEVGVLPKEYGKLSDEHVLKRVTTHRVEVMVRVVWEIGAVDAGHAAAKAVEKTVRRLEDPFNEIVYVTSKQPKEATKNENG